METFAERDVIVVLFGELEQYTGGRLGHRVRAAIVHLLAYGRGFLQVQLVAGRYEKRALGKEMTRIGQLGRPVLVIVVVVAEVLAVRTAPVQAAAGRSPRVVRAVVHLSRVRGGGGGGGRRRFWRRRRWRADCRAHVSRKDTGRSRSVGRSVSGQVSVGSRTDVGTPTDVPL